MMKDDCLIGEFVVKEMDIDEELDATYRIHYISIAK